jgi:hypothetical protein
MYIARCTLLYIMLLWPDVTIFTIPSNVAADWLYYTAPSISITWPALWPVLAHEDVIRRHNVCVVHYKWQPGLAYHARGHYATARNISNLTAQCWPWQLSIHCTQHLVQYSPASHIYLVMLLPGHCEHCIVAKQLAGTHTGCMQYDKVFASPHHSVVFSFHSTGPGVSSPNHPCIIYQRQWLQQKVNCHLT